MIQNRLRGLHLSGDVPLDGPPDGALDDAECAGMFPLGHICFGTNPLQEVPAQNACPQLSVPMAVLGTSRCDSADLIPGTGAWCEALFTDAPIQTGTRGAIRYGATEDLIFGVLSLSENPDQPTGGSPLQTATTQAYRQVFTALSELGYPHVWRYWNYMGNINGEAKGLERYRQFNRGRQAAFEQAGCYRADQATAACALGYQTFGQRNSSPLCIAFLAGKTRPVAIENPRQVKAIDYPAQYGPRSPIFSRASLAHIGQQTVLFVSGTASIVGHASLYPDDVVAQTHETLTNISLILDAANEQLGIESERLRFTFLDLSYRVYVRHAVDVPQIHAEMMRFLGGPVSALFLQADVCRQDLLVEMEINPVSPSPVAFT